MEKIVILANRLAESILMNWDEEEFIKLAKEVAVACKENIDFISLVRRMREAQKEFESDSPHMDYDKIMEVYHDKFRFESEVDEYLKKMDSIDQRKALEAENTEFDYGHNVKHYNED